MASPRELVDVEIAIQNPDFAREWIPVVSNLKYIYLEPLRRMIYFNNMTDLEAIEVARHLLGQEIDWATKELNLLDPGRHIH